MEPAKDSPASRLISETELPAIISREDLYALVWSEPISRLSRRFGLSDVGLAKACTRMMIPVPGRGYWAKKDVGRAPRPTRLPTLPASVGADKRELKVRRREAPKAVDAAREEPETIAVVVSEILTAPHPLVAKSVKAFRGGRSRHDGYLMPRTPECLAVHATMSCIDRAMRVYDAVIKAIEERGHVVEIQKYSREGYQDPQYRTVVLIDGESVEIEMTEITKRVEHVRDSPTDPSLRYAVISSGRLAIGTRNEYGRGSRWGDGARHTIESQLGQFIHGVAVAAVELKETRRRREEHQKEQLERQRREWEEADRRRAEAGRVRALDAEIDRMHSARWTREYLAQLKENLSAHPDANTPEMQDWLAWVEGYSKRIDPFVPHAVVPNDPKPYGY
jgi:hypothetical protein